MRREIQKTRSGIQITHITPNQFINSSPIPLGSEGERGAGGWGWWLVGEPNF